MNKKIITLLVLALIFLLGTFLRFYQLGKTPDSLDWDEAAWGYNAYSILHTGKDEYGVSFPISFKSFGDYKQPVYIYSEVLPIAIFGLNAFSTRFPSAFYGSLSTIFVFLLVFELLYKTKNRDRIALAGALIFAISPWSIQFSRVAFEATLGVFFVLVGLYLLLLGIRKKSNIAFVISIVSFALSAYSYHSEKIFMPLFIIVLFLLFHKYFLQRKVLTAFLLILIFLTNSLWLFNSTTTARGASVLFTSQQTQLLKNSANAIIYDHQHNDKLGVLLNNRRIVYANTFILNYLKHWDPNWLFITGDLQRHHAPGMGLLYLISLPFILFGLFVSFRDKFENRYILLIWFLLSPIASAIAIDAPNAERSLIMLPPLVIWEAVGFMTFLNWSISKNLMIVKRFLLIFVIIAYIFNFGYYLQQYFAHTNYDTQQYWQYGYQQAAEFAATQTNKNVYFDNSIEQGYIFYLFYNKFDPAKYQAMHTNSGMGKSCWSIGTVYFGSCQTKVNKGDLYITSNGDPFTKSKLINKVQYLNGNTAVYIYEKS
ncbi:MAG TPA: glycosyltransferase family 39 protein [Patescibacteria group bacterium]|nr:glycosyltransferase family 39 protein [Patescibacteria group bacterium]